MTTEERQLYIDALESDRSDRRCNVLTSGFVCFMLGLGFWGMVLHVCGVL